MSAIIQASPLEKLSQEPMPTGDSCVLIIFGASGDLTKRKLIPGLYNLACEGCMNPQFEVLGIGATEYIEGWLGRNLTRLIMSILITLTFMHGRTEN
jgi:Glucose-6-phosphate dehydrogenase, NAD binding domain